MLSKKKEKGREVLSDTCCAAPVKESYSNTELFSLTDGFKNPFYKTTYKTTSPFYTIVYMEHTYIYAPLTQTWNIAQHIQKKEEDMTTCYNEDIDTQRRILQDEIRRAFYKHQNEASKVCHMKPVYPGSLAQAIEWIEQKKYKIDEDVDINEPSEYNEWVSNIIWKTEEPDHMKHKDMIKKIEEDYEAATLRSKILEPKEMLKEVENYKKKTYH